jgi:hypothetical protein
MSDTNIDNIKKRGNTSNSEEEPVKKSTSKSLSYHNDDLRYLIQR